MWHIEGVTRALFVLPVASLMVLFAACVDEEREPPTNTPNLSGPSVGAGVGMSTSSAGGGGMTGAGGAGGNGTTTGTGGVIQPGSDCDDSGDCAACIACSVLANCVDADIECNNDPTCQSALQCYAGCDENCMGDELCYADCESTCKGIQVGWPLADALINCSCNQDCPKDCAADQAFDCIDQIQP